MADEVKSFPYDIGPFQQIVNVQWGSKILMIAFSEFIGGETPVDVGMTSNITSVKVDGTSIGFPLTPIFINKFSWKKGKPKDIVDPITGNMLKLMQIWSRDLWVGDMYESHNDVTVIDTARMIDALKNSIHGFWDTIFTGNGSLHEVILGAYGTRDAFETSWATTFVQLCNQHYRSSTLSTSYDLLPNFVSYWSDSIIDEGVFMSNGHNGEYKYYPPYWGVGGLFQLAKSYEITELTFLGSKYQYYWLPSNLQANPPFEIGDSVQEAIWRPFYNNYLRAPYTITIKNDYYSQQFRQVWGFHLGRLLTDFPKGKKVVITVEKGSISDKQSNQINILATTWSGQSKFPVKDGELQPDAEAEKHLKDHAQSNPYDSEPFEVEVDLKTLKIVIRGKGGGDPQ